LVEQSGRRFESFSEASNFLWSIADLLRGDYKQHDYGKVILPLTVLRRLDCVLLPTKAQVLAKHAALEGGSLKNADALLNRITGVPFHNVSKLTFTQLKDDPTHLRQNLVGYIEGFNQDAREIFIQRFKFGEQVDKLDESNLLYQVVSRFGEVDLHPDVVDTHMMGSIFEDLIRRFAEQANETAGEHFTPREVIRLMVDLVFTEDNAVLSQPGVVKTLYDPACGTGGMLGVAEEYLYELNPRAKLEVFGQELNDESFAICKADMMIKGQNPQNIQRGNSFSEDGHAGRQFDYMLSNPPFGVEWKKVEKEIRDEHEKLGFAGRFGAGLPRISDGSLLFLQHMVSKMRRPTPDKAGAGADVSTGSRLAVVFNGSPLFTGDAGSGESEIRRWLLENDWLEAIVALPDQLFFNTGISTYVWVVCNHKPAHRRGKVQLINATDRFEKMRKSLGDKRKLLGEADIKWIAQTYGDFAEGEASKVFRNEDFGFHKITVERPLRLNFHVSPERLERLEAETAFANLTKTKKKGEAGKLEIAEGRLLQESVRHVLNGMMTAGGKAAATPSRDRKAFTKALSAAFKKADVSVPPGVLKAVLSALSERDEDAPPCVDSKGQPEADADLRDTESVPLTESIADYFEREVKPQVPDAWIDESKTKVGYEIPFTRHFYKYEPLRPLSVIEAEIRVLEAEIQGMLGEVLG
jgi:type I restriction enzyme M protein